MPTIKLNTSGLVITKGGLPSCTCCGLCSPNVFFVYSEVVFDPGGTPSTSEWVLDEASAGGLNAGFFIGGAGLAGLYWDTDLEPNEWVFYISEIEGLASGIDGPITSRCNPQGVYKKGSEFNATVSFLPFS
jgi:hypothetical protein